MPGVCAVTSAIPAGLHVALNHGFRVFPCRQNDKRPLTKHGCKDASDEVVQVVEWSEQFPGCNWGAAMGAGIFALDLDRKDGVDGAAELTILIEKHGSLPAHLINETPNSGEHHLFRGSVVGNTASVVAPGVDVRTDGGYIVIPPSHLKAGEYRWRDAEAPIPDAPAWLLDLLGRQSARRPDRKTVIPQKERNYTLHRFACGLRGRGVPESEAWAALTLRNQDCAPPLEERELRQIFEHAWKHAPGFPCTDLGNAERLVASYGDDARYLVGAGWHLWNQHRFELDRTRRIFVLMGDVARGIYAEASTVIDADHRKALGAWAKLSESRGKLEAAIALAESRPQLVDLYEHYDADPWLVGLRNGVYDLRRDEFREGRRDDRITLCMDVDFDARAEAPRWASFQSEIHADDADMVAFKQRSLGYCLSGDTSEQKLFIQHGTGANGKSTEQSVILDLFNDYGRKAESDTLLIRDRRGAANNDIARLKGARYIATAENEDGQRLAESLVKSLTGEDRVSARFLYREHFEFQLSGKIWLATNHRPEVTGTDHALWRRVLLVPYEVVFDAKTGDPELRQKLLAERAGIFNWLLAGFRQWRVQGLAAPGKIVAATAQYRADMDRIGSFIAEQCVLGGGRTKAAEVYTRYRQWCEFNGTRFLSARKFHERMERDHHLQRTRDQTDVYPGVVLVAWEYANDL
jgi:putative DNA primase/helicase